MLKQETGHGRARLAMTAIALLLFGVTPASCNDTDVPAQPPLSTDAIVQKLMAANARRAESLRGYRGKRSYQLDYHGIFTGHAEIQVEATYRAPDEKNFNVVSESGSKLLIRRVLLKLLQSEQDAQQEQNRKDLEISPANYQFTLESTQHTPAGDFYVLNVKPKSKNKYVYQGKIWVDAHDFAVSRMDGSPATNPSFWVSHIEIHYQWARIGGFWLPVQNHSVTDVRFGGKAILNIDYSDYQITSETQPISPKGSDKSPVLPDPASISVQPH